jgi:hypothetical protein
MIEIILKTTKKHIDVLTAIRNEEPIGLGNTELARILTDLIDLKLLDEGGVTYFANNILGLKGSFVEIYNYVSMYTADHDIEIDLLDYIVCDILDKKESPKAESINLDFFDYWNKNVAKNGISKVAKITDQRRRKYNKLLQLHSKSEIFQALKKVETSSFLNGKTSYWKCDIDFFLTPNSFIKILEGKYGGNTDGKKEWEKNKPVM